MRRLLLVRGRFFKREIGDRDEVCFGTSLVAALHARKDREGVVGDENHITWKYMRWIETVHLHCMWLLFATNH
jgi:hypothetical protein